MVYNVVVTAKQAQDLPLLQGEPDESGTRDRNPGVEEDTGRINLLFCQMWKKERNIYEMLLSGGRSS